MIENNPMKDKNTRNKKIETEKNNNGGVHPIVKRNYEDKKERGDIHNVFVVGLSSETVCRSWDCER